MESALILFNQLIKMAIYSSIGYVLHKTKLISKDGCRAFSTLLLYVILPCVIISSFIREKSAETTNILLVSTLASVILILISMGISRILFGKNPIDEFSSSFSNAGFMGMPLIAAAYGSEKVFYIAAFTAFLNILQWTYGQKRLSSSIRVNIKTICLNPLVISLVLGLVFYFLQIALPNQISTCISTISGCNSPVAMIILGFYLAEIPFKDVFSFRYGYWVSFVRLMLIPIASLLILKFIPGLDILVKQIMLIAACAPVGINVAIYAQRLDNDYPRAVILICQSTVLCTISMPIIIGLSSFIL